VKRRQAGLTIVEILVVVSIIALLVGMLIPALSVVRTTARETKQKAQLTTIELALTAFKNDYGDYPPSTGWDYSRGQPLDYCGAQKLAEALVGWDLMGFHPKSDFRSDGFNNAGIYVYDANDPVLFDQRKGPYLDLATANVFRLGNISPLKPGLFTNCSPLAPDTFVLCDVFGTRKITLPGGKVVKAGAPVLYYRAHRVGNVINQIYDVRDNVALVALGRLSDGKDHPLADTASGYQFFYDYIRDPKVAAKPWPYRPDSYLLISAGADGLYGTADDICNFGH